MPDGVREHFAEGLGRRGSQLHAAWRAAFEAYRREHPERADELERMQHRRLPDGWDRQPAEYREAVLPPGVTARVAVEQASSLGWDRYVGDAGEIIAMHTFGASAPLKDVQRRFGFTPGRVMEAARAQLTGRR